MNTTSLRKRLLRLSTLAPLTVLAMISSAAEGPPDPVPDPAGQPNIWYGAIPLNGQEAPVLVFIPGMGQKANFFWTNGNDMYSDAYKAGYRTAFVSFAPDDGPPNNFAIAHNASILKTLL